jgi:hypothetical protein
MFSDDAQFSLPRVAAAGAVKAPAPTPKSAVAPASSRPSSANAGPDADAVRTAEETRRRRRRLARSKEPDVLALYAQALTRLLANEEAVVQSWMAHTSPPTPREVLPGAGSTEMPATGRPGSFSPLILQSSFFTDEVGAGGARSRRAPVAGPGVDVKGGRCRRPASSTKLPSCPPVPMPPPPRPALPHYRHCHRPFSWRTVWCSRGPVPFVGPSAGGGRLSSRAHGAGRGVAVPAGA